MYDHIGRTYARTRRTDLRLAGQLWQALGPGESLLNVGAGTGSYEPGDRIVVAVEPSLEMIRQRSSSHQVVRGVAEALPFRDGQFDAAMAILTVHHWSDPWPGCSSCGGWPAARSSGTARRSIRRRSGCFATSAIRRRDRGAGAAR